MNWISAKTPPKHRHDVLVVTKDMTVFMARWYSETGWNLYFSDAGMQYNNSTARSVTHWMPLPEPPKQDAQ